MTPVGVIIVASMSSVARPVVGHRAPPADLAVRLPHRLGLLVQQPGPRLVLQERPAVVADPDLLGEVEVLRRPGIRPGRGPATAR